ncbi:hypothetical protein [Serratia marcescens]|uniref:hypothetical protein n=2 Tax=Serratia marcescens TaxID=615 RepID=UPI00238031D1|nr:hypothetical protein [Serratia marcescens]
MSYVPLKAPSKKLIISVLSSSAFITGLTIAVIWLYLFNLDRLDIFYDAISTRSAIAVIFGFTIISTLGFSTLIFSSSFIIMLIFSNYKNELGEQNSTVREFSNVGLFNNLGSCILLITSFVVYNYSVANGYICTILFIVASLLLSYCITYIRIIKPIKITHQSNNEIKGRIGKRSMIFSLPLLLLAPAIVQILPLLFLLSQLEFTDGSSDFAQLALLTAVALTFSTLSILPGTIYINEKTNGGMLHSIIIILVSIPTALVVLSMIFRPTPNMIINLTMNLSGISDWRVHQFYIKEETHPHTMFNDLLWNTRYFQNIPSRFFITGVSVFTLGNKQLICPTTIIQARAESLKLTVDDINKYDEKLVKLKASAMNCIPFNKGEIHVWDSPILEPVYYEKIKIKNENSMIKLMQSLK